MQGNPPRPPPLSPRDDRARRAVPQGWAVVQTPDSPPTLSHGTPGYPASGPSITPIFFPSAAGNTCPRPFCAEAFLSASPVDSHNSSTGSFQRRDSVSSGFSQAESSGSPSVSGSMEQGGRFGRSQKPLSGLRTSVSVPNFFHAKPTSLLRKKGRDMDATGSVAREGAFWGDLLDDENEKPATPGLEAASYPVPPAGPRPIGASPSLSGALSALSSAPSPLSSHRSGDGHAPLGAEKQTADKRLPGYRRSFFQKPLGLTLSKLGSRGESCPDFFAQNKGLVRVSSAASVAGEGDSVSSSSSVGTDLSQHGGVSEEPTAPVPVLLGVPSAASAAVPTIFGGSTLRQVHSSPSLQGASPVPTPTTCPPPSLSRIQASELEQSIDTEFLSSLSARRLRLSAGPPNPPARPSLPSGNLQLQQNRQGNLGAISRRLSIRQLVQRSSAALGPPAQPRIASRGATGDEGSSARPAGDRPGTARFAASPRDAHPGFDEDALRVGEVSAVPEEVNVQEESGSSHGSSPEDGVSDDDSGGAGASPPGGTGS
ncbi:putative ppg3 [Neospora caninum Liverpool]|uniref:Ppg3, putative n=1 Tax=Neospora caninum (strain Liverpool) TaxID=572307 RepID=F0VBC1_NEOCL|nr:putative ppg3 [Neospora caninum Liverpool]CBZ50905.1 putative ppg3 [Neospora caninum Liverpool]CEL68207.1 TPA: ppg3, putative [Neospora caninum Liverpool]|eukprot:XP_003880938.1 putative ppg3 [Neospora caninum Liverpool]